MSGVVTLGMLGAEELGRKAVYDLQESTGIKPESCIALHIQQKRRHQASYSYISLLLNFVEQRQWLAGSKSLHFLRLDITDESSVKHFAASLEAEFGGVTVLVNNAGEFSYCSLWHQHCTTPTGMQNAFSPH